MNDLVFQNSNGNDVTTSLIVAEVFGKEHSKVMRDIENLSCSESFRVANFGYTPYTHPQNGQVYHYYEMTKDGFSFLVMGYTGTKAGEFKERFINEFNKREAMLKNDDYTKAPGSIRAENKATRSRNRTTTSHYRITRERNQAGSPQSQLLRHPPAIGQHSDHYTGSQGDRDECGEAEQQA